MDLKYTIEVGDTVEARLYDDSRTNFLTQTFEITSIDGPTYYGGVVPCNADEGWVFELLRKNKENLALPAKISEITVLLYGGAIAHVFGKNTLWTRANGTVVYATQILAWAEGFVGVETIRDGLS